VRLDRIFGIGIGDGPQRGLRHLQNMLAVVLLVRRRDPRQDRVDAGVVRHRGRKKTQANELDDDFRCAHGEPRSVVC
jgi:hypothetical protein